MLNGRTEPLSEEMVPRRDEMASSLSLESKTPRGSDKSAYFVDMMLDLGGEWMDDRGRQVEDMKKAGCGVGRSDADGEGLDQPQELCPLMGGLKSQVHR